MHADANMLLLLRRQKPYKAIVGHRDRRHDHSPIDTSVSLDNW